jgi:hypothetical protein
VIGEKDASSAVAERVAHARVDKDQEQLPWSRS